MNTININSKNNIEKFNRKKNWYRFTLGLNQLKNKPALNILWILCVPIGWMLCKCRNIFLALVKFPPFLSIIEKPFATIVTFLFIFMMIVIIVGGLQLIGNITAKEDEADMCLVFGNKRDIKNQPPILVKKNKDKKSGVVDREFYTSISMKEWQDKKDAICDRLNIHLIGNIEYGGKNHNKGNRIFFKSKAGRIQQDMGDMYDDEY